MTQKKRGLGFNPLLGLDQSTVDAVLSRELKTGDQELGDETGVVHVAIEKVVPNPFQPRTRFDESELDELADSIRQHGVMQPVILRRLSSLRIDCWGKTLASKSKSWSSGHPRNSS